MKTKTNPLVPLIFLIITFHVNFITTVRCFIPLKLNRVPFDNHCHQAKKTFHGTSARATTTTFTLCSHSWCYDAQTITTNDTTNDEKDERIIQLRNLLSIDTLDGSFGDLTSPRKWLEYLEKYNCLDQQQIMKNFNVDDDLMDMREMKASSSLGGSGVYTVCRCEAMVDTKNNGNMEIKWNILGEDFHFQRLLDTFPLFVTSIVSTDNGYHDNVSLDAPMKETQDIIRELQSKAESEILQSCLDENNNNILHNHHHHHYEFSFMLTLLWTPKKTNDVNVRAHMKYLSKSPNLQNITEPSPLNVGIIISSSSPNQSSLPNRHANLIPPMVKTSSWCRIRKPHEDTIASQNDNIGDVSEILLTKHLNNGNNKISKKEDPCDCTWNNYEILEGLTSNFFAVFSDGTIRTASDHLVLNGYVRQIILDLIQEDEKEKRLGLVYDDTPITINDLLNKQSNKNGEDEENHQKPYVVEAFLTSSIRRVVPISNIILFERSHSEQATTIKNRVIWSTAPDTRCDFVSWDPPRWKACLDMILRHEYRNIERKHFSR